jgi:hypothetical protein
VCVRERDRVNTIQRQGPHQDEKCGIKEELECNDGVGGASRFRLAKRLWQQEDVLCSQHWLAPILGHLYHTMITMIIKPPATTAIDPKIARQPKYWPMNPVTAHLIRSVEDARQPAYSRRWRTSRCWPYHCSRECHRRVPSLGQQGSQCCGPASMCAKELELPWRFLGWLGDRRRQVSLRLPQQPPTSLDSETLGQRSRPPHSTHTCRHTELVRTPPLGLEVDTNERTNAEKTPAAQKMAKPARSTVRRPCLSLSEPQHMGNRAVCAGHTYV